MKIVVLAFYALVLFSAAPKVSHFNCEQKCEEKYCNANSSRQFVCNGACKIKCRF